MEIDRNKKNEEQTKTDDTVDIHGNHQTDGNILQNSDGLQEDVVTQQKNEEVEEAPSSLTANFSLSVEESAESRKNEESGCTDGTKSLEVESSDDGVVDDGKKAENEAGEGDVDTQLMENLQVEDTK